MAPRSRAIYPRSERKACTAPIRRPCCASRSKSAAANTGPSGERTRRSRCSGEKNGGERGIRTPGTRWVQQISSLPHSTTLPSLRGRAELHILSGADAFFAAHVAAQGGRDDERAVGLLVVLEDSDERAADCEA